MLLVRANVRANVRAKVRWMGPLLLALGVAAAISGCFGLGSPDRPIAYVSEADGNPDIYVVYPDSGEISAFQRGPDSQVGPTWSPDGQRIAFVFVAGGSGDRDVKVAPLDDSGGAIPVPAGVSGQGSNEGAPLWDPEGVRLAYVSDADGTTDIYVADVDGEIATRITSSDDGELLGDWSPDGQWLVFSRRGDDDKQGLWLRNPAGVNLLQLTDGADSDPVWSSDGDAIAFVRDDFGNRDIYVIEPEDGEDWRGDVVERRWINSAEEDHSPAWAPDGDTLAFVTTRDGNAEIYVAHSGDDEPPQRLTINEASDTDPVWSPDGDRIAFVTELFGETEILVMDQDGSNQQRLTHNEVRDHSPDW